MDEVIVDFSLYSSKVYFLHFSQWLCNTMVIKIKKTFKTEKKKKVCSICVCIPFPLHAGISSSTSELIQVSLIVLNSSFLGRLENKMRNKKLKYKSAFYEWHRFPSASTAKQSKYSFTLSLWTQVSSLVFSLRGNGQWGAIVPLVNSPLPYLPHPK